MKEYREIITEPMLSYLREILDINEKINLTSIRDFESAKLLHLRDSLTVLDDINRSIPGKYADIGTGGGFPGVPLCLASGRKTTLVDSRAKKLDAIKQALQNANISLDSFTFLPLRIEDFGKNYRGEYSVITARALSSLPSVMELACPALCVGGTLIAMKANIDESELKCAKQICKKLGFSSPRLRKFTLGEEHINRCVITFDKVETEKINLPRKIGLAQKCPL